MKNKILAAAVLAALFNLPEGYAQAKQLVASKSNQDVDTRVDEANQDAPVNNPNQRDDASGGNVNYKDTKLSNYQDPYLTNPRAYKSNQYGTAATPPKPNTVNIVEPAPYRVDNYNYNATNGGNTGY